MNAYLLSLAALHAAAPGVLGVIFGPDGDFEWAPRWGGPVTIGCDPRPSGHAFVTASVDPDGLWLSGAQGNGHGLPPPDFWPWSPRLAIDLRIPSVSARLAGLCARAMGETGEGWRVCRVGPTWILTDGLTPLQWDRYGDPRCALGPHLGDDASNVYGFLASLTLALAPRIAALGGSRD